MIRNKESLSRQLLATVVYIVVLVSVGVVATFSMA